MEMQELFALENNNFLDINYLTPEANLQQYTDLLILQKDSESISEEICFDGIDLREIQQILQKALKAGDKSPERRSEGSTCLEFKFTSNIADDFQHLRQAVRNLKKQHQIKIFILQENANRQQSYFILKNLAESFGSRPAQKVLFLDTEALLSLNPNDKQPPASNFRIPVYDILQKENTPNLFTCQLELNKRSWNESKESAQLHQWLQLFNVIFDVIFIRVGIPTISVLENYLCQTPHCEIKITGSLFPATAHA